MGMADDIVNDLVGRYKPITKPKASEKPSGMARVGRGMMDVAQGGKQLYLMATDPEEASQYTQQVNDEIALYEQGRGEDAGIDWLRLGGNVAASLPAALVAPQTLAGSAAVGAGTGAVMYNPGGTWQDKALQTGAGAAGGAVGYGVAKGVGAVGAKAEQAYRGIKGKISQDKVIALLEQEHGIPVSTYPSNTKAMLINEARKQLKATGSLDVESLSRKARLEKLGFKPTSGQVTRDPAEWQFEQNWSAVRGVGDDMRYQLAGQNDVLRDNLGNVVKSTGGKPMTDYELGDTVQTAIRNIDDDLSTAVSSAYKDIQAASGNKGAITVDNLLGKVKDLQRYTYSRGMADDVLGELKRMGLVDDAGNLAQSEGSQPALTAMQAEELRKFINKFPGFAGGTNMQGARGDLIGSLDDDIFAGLKGQDVYGPARALHQERKTLMAADPLAKMTSKDGMQADNIYKNFVLSGKVHDLGAMKKVMEKTDEGKAAFDSVRRSVAQDIMDSAFNQDPTRKSMTEAGFRKMVERIGPEKMEILFGKDTAKYIFDNLEAVKDLTIAPPMTKMSSSNSATPMLDAFFKLGDIPLIGNNPVTLGVMGMVGRGKDAITEAAVKKSLQKALEGGTITPQQIQALQAFKKESLTRLFSPYLAPAGAVAVNEAIYP